MKLETTLEERPGFLHAMPFFDLLILVTMILLLGPMFLSHSGVVVELPPSQFQMERYKNSIVVTLGPGEMNPRLHLGRQAVSMEELASQLAVLNEDEQNATAIVMLKTDAGVSVAMERQVSEIILASGFKLALVGSSSPEQKLRPSGEAGR